MLMPEDVKKMVAELKEIVGDDECAHGMEDTIHQTVLEEIAKGECMSPGECAREALKTKELDFNRWCA
jgi:hypothetical protein